MKNISKALLVATLSVNLVACAGSGLRPTDVSRTDARKAETVREGTVLEIYEVTLRGNTEVAQGTGAVLGGYVANRATKDSNEAVQVLATAAGAVVGSVVGESASNMALDKPGLNIVVKLDSGGTLAISQQTDTRTNLQIGGRVYLIGSGNNIRILPKE